MSTAINLNVASLGFGEAGGAFVEGWAGQGPSVAAFDIKTTRDADRPKMLAKYQRLFVAGRESAVDAVAVADIVFSFVTADQALTVAASAADGLKSGALYFDCNSCAPDTKRQAAALINAAGGRYVDVAVMAPVYPHLNKTKVLVSGPAADAALDAMAALDMVAEKLDGDVGRASSTKMIRSIMMKGLEALMVECVLAGRTAGVDDLVLDSLEKTYPGFGWKDKAAHMLERTLVHGHRRAAEMREVALTVEQLGLDNPMARATVEWQQKMGDLALDPGEHDYRSRADAVLAAIGGEVPKS